MGFNNFLNLKCNIESRIQTQDAATGQMENTWTVKYRNVSCRLDGADGNEIYTTAQKIEQATHILFLENKYQLLFTDRIKIDTNYYNVLGINDAGGQGHHQEIPVLFIQ